jgi:hypothetical protein
MPTLKKPSTQPHATDRLEIASIILIEVLIVVAVLIAALFYIHWSSNAALVGFFSATSSQSPQPPTLTQPVKSRKTCFLKV